MKYNAAYAAKVEKSKARKDAKKSVASPPKPASTANPFSVSLQQKLIHGYSSFDKMQAPLTPMPFGLGDQIFGNTSSNSSDLPPPATDDQSDSESEASDSEESLITAMASVTIQGSAWATAPSYPPAYLSTMSEYIPPEPKFKIPSNAQMEEPTSDNKQGKDASWGLEGYENALKVDSVFDRFTKRVGHTAEQCLR